MTNWRSAGVVARRTTVVDDLIRIGVALGPEIAERIYLSLREEPRDIRGDRVDWIALCEVIDALRQLVDRSKECRP